MSKTAEPKKAVQTNSPPAKGQPEAKKAAHTSPPAINSKQEAFLNWQKDPEARSPDRTDHLKAWGEYNGLNPVTGTEIDNKQNVVHALKNHGQFPVRGKVEAKPSQEEKAMHVDPARREQLKGWHDYNGLNPINGAAVDNSANAVHASTSKPAGAPQGRIKPAAVEKPAEKAEHADPARKEQLKAWHEYNGMDNVITQAPVQNMQNVVHASSNKPANTPQGRIKPAAAERPAQKEPSEERRERLKEWGTYSGFNPVTGAEVASSGQHVPSTRPSNAPPVRGKGEARAPAGKVMSDLFHSVSGNKEFLSAMAAKAHKP